MIFNVIYEVNQNGIRIIQITHKLFLLMNTHKMEQTVVGSSRKTPLRNFQDEVRVTSYLTNFNLMARIPTYNKWFE